MRCSWYLQGVQTRRDYQPLPACFLFKTFKVSEFLFSLYNKVCLQGQPVGVVEYQNTWNKPSNIPKITLKIVLSTKIKKGLSTNPFGKDKIINTYVINMYTVWTHFDWKNIKRFSLKIRTDFEFFYEYGKVVPNNFTSFKSYRIFFCNLCVPVLCGFWLEKMVKCDRKCFWKKELKSK